MSIVREKLVKEDIELGHGTALVTDPTDPTGNQLTGNKIGIHTFVQSVYNVKDFGADGDGVSDDTAAIQAAITTAGADSVILFPVGDYLISDPITITNSNVVLRGLGTRWASGHGALIQSNDASSDVLQITGVDNVLVENLSLRHKIAAAFGFYVIDVQGGSQILIDNCTIVSASGTTNCKAAIRFAATASQAISNCRVRACYIKDISNEGIWVEGNSPSYRATNVAIEDCTIDNCDTSGIHVSSHVTNLNIDGCRIMSCGGSISMVPAAVSQTDQICIRNCSFKGTTTSNHIDIDKIENVLIQNNRFKDCLAGYYAIAGDTDCQYCSIIGNHIINMGAGGIYWDGDNTFISSNYIDWGTGAGITLAGNSFANYVSDNLVRSSGGKYADTGTTNVFGFNFNAVAPLMRALGAAPGDSSLENGDLTVWLNEGGNALTFKVKYSGGTVKSGTVALT